MKRFLHKTADAMMAIACISLAACVLTNAYEIFMRFFFAKSLYWIQDFTLLTMLWFIFPGMVKIANKGNDISVDLFLSKLPGKAQRVVKMAVDILVTLFSLCLFYFSADMFRLRIGQVKTTSSIPLNLYTVAIMVSMLLMSLVYIEKLTEQLKKEGGAR